MRISGKARARTRKSRAVHTPALLVVLVAAIAVVIGIIAFSSTGAGSTGGRTTSAGQAGDTAGAAAGSDVTGGSRGGKGTSARKPVLAQPRQAPVTRGAKWVTGTADRLLSAVNADMGRISADQRAGNYGAARSAGVKLAADALAALKGPMPPVDTAIYRSALKDFERIGNDTANGDFGAVGSLLAPANLGIMRVTAAADPPAPVAPVAQANG